MSFIDGKPLNQIREMANPKLVYETMMSIIVQFAEVPLHATSDDRWESYTATSTSSTSFWTRRANFMSSTSHRLSL